MLRSTTLLNKVDKVEIRNWSAHISVVLPGARTRIIGSSSLLARVVKGLDVSQAIQDASTTLLAVGTLNSNTTISTVSFILQYNIDKRTTLRVIILLANRTPAIYVMRTSISYQNISGMLSNNIALLKQKSVPVCASFVHVCDAITQPYLARAPRRPSGKILLVFMYPFANLVS